RTFNAVTSSLPSRPRGKRYCRRAALKRMTRDIKEDADEAARTMAHKSDGMNNVSSNMLGSSDESSSDDSSNSDGSKRKKKADLKKAA
ncbi:unnamed protein product, partial [Choristocarpus tenellus]